jgi:MFS transporter, FSR family, fosmidomycin resistance protein
LAPILHRLGDVQLIDNGLWFEALTMNHTTTIEESEFKTGGVATVAVAHAVHDTYSAFLPALLPLLIEKFALSNTLAGLFTVFYQIPSLLQPLIGRLADRKNLRFMVILAPTITGAAMSSVGLAPSYGFAAFLLILAGISSSTLHATGPVLGSALSGNRLGRGMSFWMVGGELGRALGPLITVTAIAYLTLDGLPWLMLAGVLTSIFLFIRLDPISTRTNHEDIQLHWRAGLNKLRRIMLPLAVILFIRSLAMSTLTTFLPTFLTREGTSLWMAGFSLTILEVSGMVGAFLAGGLSDRFGRRRMLVISFVATPILMFLFVRANAFWKLPLLVFLGFFAIAVVPVFMAIVMENAADQRAFANGVYMATSFVLHALAIIVVGLLADLIDLRFTFLVSAGLLPLCLPFVRLLPKSVRSA